MKTLRAMLLGVLFCAGMALVALPATAAGGGETIVVAIIPGAQTVGGIITAIGAWGAFASHVLIIDQCRNMGF